MFSKPLPTTDERRALGRARRGEVPRRSHAELRLPDERVDPVDLLVSENATRLHDLVPVRVQRMLASPFAFYRGSALQMAHDLVDTPRTGAEVIVCGDAHIANFGVFATPERRMVFDLNDFDEVCFGPFEWDVKRFAASIVLAGRHAGIARHVVDRTVVKAIATYTEWMHRFAAIPLLDMFYAHVDTEAAMSLVRGGARTRAQAVLDKAASKDNMKALAKLVVLGDDGRWQIVPDPPLVERIEDSRLEPLLDRAFKGYAASLAVERQGLFGRYRFVDFARKVVGVGSVGTRCWVALFQGWNGDPLFLQIKQAGPAAPTVALGREPAQHEGRRVVNGQHALQASSDIMLGWTTDPDDGAQYYVRQLWDAKGSADVEALTAKSLGPYTRLCAGTLARAHARTGDPAFIAGYLGTSSRFAEAVAEYACAYADQSERDYAALTSAVAAGRIPGVPAAQPAAAT
ncbi:MAG: DUF2252 domain-containing protein [Ilumatobacteraceae bacterium]